MIAGMRSAFANILLRVLPSTRAFGLKRACLRFLGFHVGEDTRVASGTCFFGSGKVSLGASCWIGLNVSFYTVSETQIIIGDDCDIAPNVIFHSGTHKLGCARRRAGELAGGTIVIGRGTWIGVGAKVLAGATIGEGCIVAAGAVVTGRAYAGSTLIAGVPAKEIRQLE